MSEEVKSSESEALPAAPDPVQYRLSVGSLEPAGKGERFDVLAIAPGEANGLLFSEDVLRRSVPLWDGATMFVDHGDFGRTRSVADVAGVFHGARYDGGIRGVMRCAGPAGALVSAVAREILSDRESGEPAPRVGLSADVWLVLDRDRKVTDIRAVNSLDVVVNPAAGGAFMRALNSVQNHEISHEFHELHEEKEQDAGSAEGVKMEQDEKVVQAAEVSAVEPAAEAPAFDMARGLLQMQCGMVLDQALTASQLPAPLQDVVRKQFAGRVFDAGQLANAIEEQRTVWAKLIESDVVKGMGRARAGVQDMQSPMDRLRFAVERMFGLPIPSGQSDLPRLSGVRELYQMLTGDYEYHGMFRPERVTFANATKTTMANLVADSLNKILLDTFNVREKWWEPIVLNRPLSNFQDMKMIRPYGFSALSTVSEGNPYTEKTWDDIKETAAIVKKGNYIGLTIEMLMSDDTDSVVNIPRLLGSAAWNALSDSVAEIFSQASGLGPTLADTTRLFDAGATRGNLLTTALSASQFDTVATAMMNQTEPGSSRKLGVPPAYLLVPTALRSTGIIIRNSRQVVGSGNNDINPWYEAFEVIVVPPWTDTNDWACVAPPKLVPGIVLGWLFDKREPEIFVADDELVGSMFTNDEMRIKARFFICVGVADHRGLHKSNVT